MSGTKWDKEETRYNLGADIGELGKMKRRLLAQADFTEREAKRISQHFARLMNELDDAVGRIESR